MQSNLDSSSLSGTISSDAGSHPAMSNEPTWIADNVAEIAPDNSSLEMLATAATSYERVARDSAYRLMKTRARTQTGMSISSPQFNLPSRAVQTEQQPTFHSLPQIQEMPRERPTTNISTLSLRHVNAAMTYEKLRQHLKFSYKFFGYHPSAQKKNLICH